MTEPNKKESNQSESNENISPRTKSYIKYLVIILTGVIILDGYGSVFPAMILSAIADEFLSEFDTNVQNSLLALTMAIASGGMYFLFFTQYLADKVGRKKMLTVSVFGMTIAVFGMFFSTTYIMWVISTFLLSFFVSSDMWLLYVNEESDPDKRARNSNIMMCGGIIGPVAAVLFRAMFITDTTSYWRGVALFPMILGLILFIIVLFKVKETSKYEVMKETGIQKRPIKEDFKSIFKMKGRRSYFSLLLITFVGGATLTWGALFEKYVSDVGTVSQSELSIIFFLAAISSFIAFVINGIVADRIGRKALFCLWTTITPIAVIIIVFGALDPQNAFFLVAFGFILTHIAGLGTGGMMRLITIESLPTDRRGTGIGFRSIVGTLGGTLGLLLNSAVILIIGLGMSFIIFSLGSYLIIPIALFFMKETKSVELEEIE